MKMGKTSEKRKNNGCDQTETNPNAFAFAFRIYNTISVTKKNLNE